VRGQLTERFEIEHTTIQIEVVNPGDGTVEPACSEICEPSASTT